MWSLLSQAAGFGVVAGTSIGPLHTLLLNVTLAYGWRTGLMIVLSPLATDIPIILVMLLLLSQLPPAFGPTLSVLGAFAVFYIAFRTARDLMHASPSAVVAASAPPSRQMLVRGMMLNFLNPAPYIFWGTITGPLLREALAESWGGALLFLVAFYVPFLGLMLGFMVIFDRVRRLDPRITRAISLFSVALMTVLGVSLLAQGIQGFAALS
ncbi:MAG: LysE family transporter [Anaerolineae bacterium]|jgi:threonine/homoserine/homoserine lactone efflux protein|nr:LysE family transporter [Anaerolineae bacterium]